MRKSCKSALIAFGIFALIQTQVWGDQVSINLYAAKLKTAGGLPMPASGLVILVASTNDATFGGPTVGGFVSGDDIELARWDLSSTGTNELFEAANGLNFFGGWGANDPLAIYWFPTLNVGSVAPSVGTTYGFYRDTTSGVDSSDPWVTPSAGSTVSLQFLTADAGGTNNLASAGNASLVVTNNIACPAITLSPSSLPAGTSGVAYSQSVVAGGGVSPYAYTLLSGNLPAGIVLGAGGSLTGTPTNTGTFNFVISVVDSNGCTGNSNYSITVSCPTISLSPAGLAGGTAGVAYSASVTASGGSSPYTYAKTGNLPGGVSLSASGVLSGTPTNTGSFNFTVTATDKYGCSSSGSNYSINVACPTISLSPTTLPNPTVGAAYSQSVSASGGIAPYTYTNISGALPAGLNLSTSGLISGTPSSAGGSSFTIQATDANGCSGNQAYTVTVGTASSLALGPTSLGNATNGVAYVANLSASGGTAPFNYTVTSGSLPGTLSLSTNGTISGTPNALGVYTFTATVTDAASSTASRTYKLKVLPVLPDSIAPVVKIVSPLKNAVVTNAPLTFTGTAADKIYVAAVHYWLDDNTNNPATGDAAGTTSWSVVLPTAPAGAHTLTVVAEDLNGNKSAPASITVHFGTNSFAGKDGVYDGLFSSTGTNNFVHQNSGYFQTKVTVKDGKLPTFSVKLSVDGNKVSGAGTFEMNGVGTLKKVIDRATKFGKPNLGVELTLPLNNSGTISGVVGPTNGVWSSVMAGYKAVTTNTQIGSSTMVLPGNPANSANEPGGSGYGLVFMETNYVKVSGSKLADGQSFGQKVNLNAAGLWPLYSVASKDSAAPPATRSVVMGWLKRSNGVWVGTLAWEKQSGSLDLRYPGGFTTATEVAMSPYFGADPGASMILPYSVVTLPGTNATVVFSGGGLGSDLINSVALSTSTGANKFTTDKVRKLTVSVTPKTGKLAVGFLNPYDSNQKASGFGVVLTNTATGHGYFLPFTGSRSGDFTLQELP